MKLEAHVLQNLAQQQKLSTRQQQDPKILEVNNQELEFWIEEEPEENPLLEFDDAYETGATSHSRQDFDLSLNSVTNERTLTGVLQEWIATYPHPLHKELVGFIANSLDRNGRLQLKDEDIQRMLPRYSLDDIEDVVNEIQAFEPARVCARGLQEYLLIQLCLEDIPYSQIAIMIINSYLKKVNESKFPAIAEVLQIPLENMLQTTSSIRSLDPKPGAHYAVSSAYVNPDMQVIVEKSEIHIQMSRKTYGLRLQAPVKDAGADTVKYLSQQQKQAEALLSSIERRNSTIKRIMEAVVVVQQGFFLHHGQPKLLDMRDIAVKLSLHEFAISRAVSGKSILFEQQIIPLKFFFPTRVNKDTGADGAHLCLCSLIDQGDKKKPYNDQELRDLLKEDGLEISRKTIAKYRDQLKVPTTSKRKQF